MRVPQFTRSLSPATVVCSAVCVALLPACSTTNDTSDSRSAELELLSWAVYHTPEYVDVDRGRLFVGTNTLVVVDVTNPAQPVELGHMWPDPQGWPRSLVVRDNLAFVAWEGHGLRVLDVGGSVPEVIADDIEVDTELRRLDVVGSRLYALGRRQGLEQLVIMDVADPRQPVVAGRYHFGDAGSGRVPERYVVNGEHVFVSLGPRPAPGPAGLAVIDAGDPSSPQMVADLPLGTVLLSGGYGPNPHLALVRTGTSLLVSGPFENAHDPRLRAAFDVLRVDVTAPDAPRIETAWSWGIGAADLALREGHLYLTDHASQLFVIDLADPAEPTASLHLPVPDWYAKDFAIRIEDGLAYLTHWDSYAVHVVDLADPARPTLAGAVPFGHDLTRVRVGDNGYAYASVWDFFQLYSIDVRDPHAPRVVARTEFQGAGWGVTPVGRHVYVAAGGASRPASGVAGVMIYDVSSPAAPRLVGHSPHWPGGWDLDVSVDPARGRAYVAVGELNMSGYGLDPSTWSLPHESAPPGMRIVDVQDPAAPRRLGEYRVDTQVWGISVEGDRAYLAAREGGLHVVNVADPERPRAAGAPWRHGSDWVRAVAVVRGRAHVCSGSELWLLDVADPARVAEIGYVDLGAPCHDVVVDDDNLALVTTADALHVIDVAKPAAPLVLATQRDFASRTLTYVDRAGDEVYVTSHLGGLYVFRLHIAG